MTNSDPPASGSIPALPQERLEEIRKREQAATEGPWSVARCEGEHGEIDYDIESPHEKITSKIACAVERRHDAELVAHARQDIPDLLAALTQAQETIAQLTQERDRLRNFIASRECRAIAYAASQLQQKQAALGQDQDRP